MLGIVILHPCDAGGISIDAPRCIVQKGVETPLVYFPMASLKKAGIEEFYVVGTPRQIQNYNSVRNLLKEAQSIKVKFFPIEKPFARIGQFIQQNEDIINNRAICIIRGDYIFSGPVENLIKLARRKSAETGKAILFVSGIFHSSLSPYLGTVESMELPATEITAAPNREHPIPYLIVLPHNSKVLPELTPSWLRGKSDSAALSVEYMEMEQSVYKGDAYFDMCAPELKQLNQELALKSPPSLS